MKRRTFLAMGGAAAGLSTVWAPALMAQDAPMIPDMILGDADAPIEMIEYASFTCPHCARFHADVFKQLKANYIDTGKVRFVYREVYFDRPGLWASMVARCGGEMRFFGIADLIYEKQREWTASGDPATIVAELRTLAKTAGLTDDMLDACMQDAEMAQALYTWYQENAERDGIRSTPSFLIDGELRSNMGYSDFQAILDAKLG